MLEWSCCDNPNVTIVREEPTTDGGKRKYYKCLDCGTDHVVTESIDGQQLDYQTSR
jgi:ferredoxin-like protein FixX